MSAFVWRLVEIAIFPISYRAFDTTRKEIKHIGWRLFTIVESFSNKIKMLNMVFPVGKLFIPYLFIALN